MDAAREKLIKYRLEKQRESPKQEEPVVATPVPSKEPPRTFLSRLFDIDVLDALPFRLWRKAYDQAATITILSTFIIYLIGQTAFVYLQFGLVFFVMSVLTAICLSLGQRKENEVSAYSVFNKNCERLLGQMTPEHFERDVLRRRIN